MVNEATEAIATTPRLILASDSPRRRELVGALDLPLELASPGGEEGAPREDESAKDFVLRLSLEKALRVAGQAGDAVVLGADTAVVLDATVLGKPVDDADADQMLRKLRGRGHTVVTGVTVLHAQSARRVSAAKATEVTMRDYSDTELAAYVASGEPLDKAGAYAVQDDLFRPARDVSGCYLNVVGLPMCEVVSLLHALGLRPTLRRGWRLPDECHDCPLESRVEVSRK